MGKIELICAIIGTAFTVITSIIGAMVWLFRRYSKKEREHIEEIHRLSNIENKINTLPCDKHGSDINRHDTKIDRTNSILESNNRMLTAISKWIMKLDPNMIEPISDAQQICKMVSEKKSPRRLNKMGEKFYKELDGENFLEAHKDSLFEVIDSLAPKTAYDVELYSLRALQIKSDEDFFNEYKLYVYNAPTFEIEDENGNTKPYELTLSDICYILSLPLRDMYLETHPDILR